ncbi:hypothetical protein QOZ80_2BG0204790 [Eleusine coracana subsp. coracana]|nr:hypothetical protein QOZ80_2BG0204790 [Eleusine coracana subsp. coracana]
MEEEEDFLKVLRALRDAARSVEAGEDRGGPALHALLALEAGADDLLSGDPSLSALRRHLHRLRALWCSLDLSRGVTGEEGGCALSFSSSLRARWKRWSDRRGIARAAGGIAAEIQAWIDRELVARLVAALLRRSDAYARFLLAELESRLLLSVGRRFDPRLQRALLQHGVFAAVESRLGEPGGVGDGCAAATLALVRFNKDVFVGPVLMGRAVGALVASASEPALRALDGLLAAIRSPLVDELHARGDLPRLVALLSTCAPDPPRVRVPAFDLALRVAYYGRKEVVDALLAEGIVKRLLSLQRSDLGGSLLDAPCCSPRHKPADGTTFLLACLPAWWAEDCGGAAALASEERPFASAVARFAVQVEIGEGLSPREKRETKLEILRRVKEAAVSPAEEATVLTEVLWGATL